MNQSSISRMQQERDRSITAQPKAVRKVKMRDEIDKPTNSQLITSKITSPRYKDTQSRSP